MYPTDPDPLVKVMEEMRDDNERQHRALVASIALNIGMPIGYALFMWWTW